MIVPNMHLLEIEAPEIAAKIKPGQFIIVRPDEDGERIPLSVADWDQDKKTITVVYMEAGASTGRLTSLTAGESIPTCVGPLGNATEIGDYGTVMVVAGCYGIGSIYPVVRELKSRGNKVITVMEARSSYLLYWASKFVGLSDKIVSITRDGSQGYKGHVSQLPDVINSMPMRPDRIFVNGCTYLMARTSEITRSMGIPTVVNLNPIMIDGTGMCGVCRVTVSGNMKFACVDGPEFNGHQVDWQEFLARRKQYLDEEALYFRRSDPKPPAHGAVHKEGKCQA